MTRSVVSVFARQPLYRPSLNSLIYVLKKLVTGFIRTIVVGFHPAIDPVIFKGFGGSFMKSSTEIPPKGFPGIPVSGFLQGIVLTVVISVLFRYWRNRSQY